MARREKVNCTLLINVSWAKIQTINEQYNLCNKEKLDEAQAQDALESSLTIAEVDRIELSSAWLRSLSALSMQQQATNAINKGISVNCATVCPYNNQSNRTINQQLWGFFSTTVILIIQWHGRMKVAGYLWIAIDLRRHIDLRLQCIFKFQTLIYRTGYFSQVKFETDRWKWQTITVGYHVQYGSACTVR
jgi:hypothetical protein